jgi:hypothetical protein
MHKAADICIGLLSGKPKAMMWATTFIVLLFDDSNVGVTASFTLNVH